MVRSGPFQTRKTIEMRRAAAKEHLIQDGETAILRRIPAASRETSAFLAPLCVRQLLKSEEHITGDLLPETWGLLMRAHHTGIDRIPLSASFRRRLALSASIIVLGSCFTVDGINAQTAPSPAESAPPVTAAPSNLPPVTVTARRAKPRVRRPERTRAATTSEPAPSASAPETAYGPVQGYVATRSATGTKTDTPLTQTPQSISVVPRDQIEAQNADSAKQALRYTAGVAGESRGNFGGYDIMYGRGFILDQYLDGMKLPGAAGQFPPQPEMYGIERVELLRGPASMLFGQGSLGGLVNLVSKRPSEIPFNEMFIQGGNYDRIQGGFDSTGKIDKNGDFLYRVTGFAKDADNQVNFVKDQRYYIAPSLTWRPDKQTSWTILATYQKDPSVGYYNFVPATGSLFPNPNGKIPTSFYAGDPNFNTNERTTASVTSLFSHDFNDTFTFRQNNRYIDTKGNFAQALPLFLDTIDNTTLSRYAQGVREHTTSFTSDTQLEFRFSTAFVDHKLLVGFDNQTTTFDQSFARSAIDFGSPLSAPPISVFNPIYGFQILNPLDDPTSAFNSHTNQTLQQNGIYAQDQLKIGRLTIVGGLRYDSAQIKTNTLNTGAFDDPSSFVRQNDHATTGRVGAIYEFDSGFAPYVTYATSFNPSVGVDASNNPLKPTTGELYEAGIKFQPKGSKIFAQASIFDLTQQNVLSVGPGFPAPITQIGEVHSQGIEIEGRASITDRLDILASFTHVNPVVTRSISTDLGKRPTWVPQDVAAAWADYTFRDGPLTGFGAAMGVRYTGQTWGDKENAVLNIPSYTLFDAAIHYELVNLDPRLKGARLSVNATNLFDKVYVSQCTAQNDNNCVYGLRRQVLATLRYRW